MIVDSGCLAAGQDNALLECAKSKAIYCIVVPTLKPYGAAALAAADAAGPAAAPL